MEPPPLPPHPTKTDRRNAVTLKLLFIAGLVLLLQWPLHLVNGLRQEDFALLAGTGALFAALAAVMYFTRHLDWHAQDARTNPLPGVGCGMTARPKHLPRLWCALQGLLPLEGTHTADCGEVARRRSRSNAEGRENGPPGR